MSEKVKEIKKALENAIDMGLVMGKNTMFVNIKLADILTLINELESENERLRLERDVLIGKKIVEKQKHDNAIIMKIDIQKQLKDRLAKLEDKIENGTLIELPCKVGDTVYHLSDKKICEEVVKQIKYSIYNGEIDLFNSHIMTDDNYSKDYNFYRVSKLGKSLFLTKSEAEAKLKELQGEQQ